MNAAPHCTDFKGDIGKSEPFETKPAEPEQYDFSIEFEVQSKTGACRCEFTGDHLGLLIADVIRIAHSYLPPEQAKQSLLEAFESLKDDRHEAAAHLAEFLTR